MGARRLGRRGVGCRARPAEPANGEPAHPIFALDRFAAPARLRAGRPWGRKREYRMAHKPKRRQTANDKPTHEAVDQAALSEPPADKPQPDDGETLEYTELVLLVHAGNLAEAELFKAELRAHGIPAMLEGEGAGVAGIPDVGAGVPVLVPEELANQAAELIAELESTRPEDDELENEAILDKREGDLEDIDDWDDDDDEEDDDV